MVLFQHPYHPNLNITILDLVLFPVVLGIIYVLAKSYADRKLKNDPFYEYLPKAITLKVIVSLIFALTVLFFYPGDSMAYFRNINCINKLLFINPDQYFDILLNGNKPEYFSYFTNETGYPAGYMWRDPNAVFVARIYSPLMILTYNNYIFSTIIAGIIGFTGIWKLYVLFARLYPTIKNKLAIAILFFPSLLFWSSGLMKDTLTMSAIGWILYSFYNFAILKKFRPKYVIAIIFSAIIIINIKAYIFAALLPGLFVLLFFNQLQSIKSGILRMLIAPLLLVLILSGFALIMSNLSNNLGEFGDIDKTLQRAQLTQQDLTRSEQYGDNYYDIGKFEATPVGVLRKFPIATISGIFRPFIWEASNPFILLAGLESLFLMLFLIYAIYKTGLISFFKNVLADPMLIFSFSFIIIFGFGVGLATANFGALVRYKIPLLPFFLSSLFILANRINEIKKPEK